MTCQAPEILIYRGDELLLCSEPLILSGVAGKISRGGSLCWRGYIGTWVIDDKKLYLTKLKQHEIEGADPIPIKPLFPHSEGRVFAD